MAKARQLVATYSAAGFGKIHLDTSMSCSDDPPRLTDETVAIRAAELCQAAEAAALQHHGTSELLYVIGTEVPPPGGAAEDTAAFRNNGGGIGKARYRDARVGVRDFGLHDAWERVIALVVQPGVEFDNRSVRDYEPCDAQTAQQADHRSTELVFEAHSTDYQLPDAYAALIRDHFAILKSALSSPTRFAKRYSRCPTSKRNSCPRQIVPTCVASANKPCSRNPLIGAGSAGRRDDGTRGASVRLQRSHPLLLGQQGCRIQREQAA